MHRNFNYARLKDIVANVKPFKLQRMAEGIPTMYPFDNRKHTYKYFTVDHDTDGQEMYRVGYYQESEKITISTEEFESKYKPNLTERQIKHYWYDKGDTWETYVYKPATQVILRADNTVEFTRQFYGQGERQFLNGQWGRRGYIASSAKHGGMIYHAHKDGKKYIMPIFQGFRFNPDTNEVHDSSKYTVTIRTINRKTSKEVVKQYEDKFNLAKAIFSSMTNEVYRDQINSIIAEHMPQEMHNGRYYLSNQDKEKAIKLADSLLYDKPIDAFLLYIKGLNLYAYYGSRVTEAFDSYQRAIKGVTKRLYYINDTFEYTTYDHTQSLISSSWVIDIKVNNNIVVR